MPNHTPHHPRPIPQVMVSSTFTDLEEHQKALIEAIHQYKFHANVMENDSAKLLDIIDSSLQMVRDSAGYIGVISHKYGQTPECPQRNPNKLSTTELEFNEALRLERPILLFIMGKKHPITLEDIESDPEKKAKLVAFRERAKQMSSESDVHRVYAEFNSLEEFKSKIGPSIHELSRHLPSPDARGGTSDTAIADPIPKPPAFFAMPDYIGSHKFVGRHSQLQELDDWAKPADPANLLLFDAIGGIGKSILTWEWTTRYAAQVRPDWTGRFWYSFYERGAIMADFCRYALAYMTGRPMEELRKMATAQLKEPLLAQLHDRPWLLILDGLERVLVAYHRIDAAEVPDEEVNAPTDKIAQRNPCDAIREEDNDLLRALAAAVPSKILVTSRLTPRVLLNPAGQPINGVKRIPLPGLRPPDAEKLLNSCGVTGDSAAIQSYLTSNCDNHPLVIGVLAGLIKYYLPDRGNFDAWSADPDGGGQLNLARLDLIQRRNHILRAALAALPPESAEVLSTVALLSESFDYEFIKAFNPHLPPELDELKEPEPLVENLTWSEEKKAKRRKQYEADLKRWQDYDQAVKARLASAEYREAPNKLAETVRDLEDRGLLQYDGHTKRYDLHPVVRGVAAGGLRPEELERCGRRVVDHFSSQPHNPYKQAETLEDIRLGMNVIRTLIKLGRFREAVSTYAGDFSDALFFNLDAYREILSLLRPFFRTGWGELPKVSVRQDSYLPRDAAIALQRCSEFRESLAAYGAALRADLKDRNWRYVVVNLHNISCNLTEQNLLAKAFRVDAFALAFANLCDDGSHLFLVRTKLFADQSRIGQWKEAEAAWQLLDSMRRPLTRMLYRSGRAEHWYARFKFWQGTLREEHLKLAERLASADKNRFDLREVHGLRGAWLLEQGEWALALESLQEAVRMARERSLIDVAAETGLALAKFYLGQLDDPQSEAERLTQARQLAPRLLAQLWLAIGDRAQAKQHALAAYKWAWADGEPYVNRYELTKTTGLLQRLAVPIPNLPTYDPAKNGKFLWEDPMAAVIEKLRAEKEAKYRQKV